MFFTADIALFGAEDTVLCIGVKVKLCKTLHIHYGFEYYRQ